MTGYHSQRQGQLGQYRELMQRAEGARQSAQGLIMSGKCKEVEAALLSISTLQLEALIYALSELTQINDDMVRA